MIVEKRKIEILHNNEWRVIELRHLREGDTFRVDGEYVYISDRDPRFNDGVWGITCKVVL